MAVKLDNIDDVINQLAKMETSVSLTGIRLARRKMRNIMKRMKTKAKKDTPKQTGALQKSMKIKGRSKRGRTNVRLVWDILYSGPVNFKKGQKAEKFATNLWEKEKKALDDETERILIDSMIEVIEAEGIKVVR